MNQQQREVIDYLQEENRVLREQLGPRRWRLTDAQRRRLAAKAGVAPDLDRQAIRWKYTSGSAATARTWPRSAR